MSPDRYVATVPILEGTLLITQHSYSGHLSYSPSLNAVSPILELPDQHS